MSEHICLNCDKSYTTSQGLANHTRRFKGRSCRKQKKELFVCSYCDNSFSTSSGLSRHKKQCNEKAVSDKKIKELEEKVILLMKRNQTLQKDKERFASIAETNSQIAATTSQTASNSVSALTFLMTNYKNTPPLQAIKDPSTMLIEFDDNDSFVLLLISKYNHNTLVAYIGDYIVNVYKKTDSSKQSIWSSDVTRLTYIISEAVSQSKSTWLTDKKGVKVKERIIRPVLTYIKPLLQAYIQKLNIEINSDKIRPKRAAEILDYLKTATDIIIGIDNKEIEQNVTKYICSFLYFNKNKLLDDKTVI